MAVLLEYVPSLDDGLDGRIRFGAAASPLIEPGENIFLVGVEPLHPFFRLGRFLEQTQPCLLGRRQVSPVTSGIMHEDIDQAFAVDPVTPVQKLSPFPAVFQERLKGRDPGLSFILFIRSTPAGCQEFLLGTIELPDLLARGAGRSRPSQVQLDLIQQVVVDPPPEDLARVGGQDGAPGEVAGAGREGDVDLLARQELAVSLAQRIVPLDEFGGKLRLSGGTLPVRGSIATSHSKKRGCQGSPFVFLVGHPLLSSLSSTLRRSWSKARV